MLAATYTPWASSCSSCSPADRRTGLPRATPRPCGKCWRPPAAAEPRRCNAGSRRRRVIIRKCLDPEPRRRYGSAGDLQEDGPPAPPSASRHAWTLAVERMCKWSGGIHACRRRVPRMCAAGCCSRWPPCPHQANADAASRPARSRGLSGDSRRSIIALTGLPATTTDGGRTRSRRRGGPGRYPDADDSGGLRTAVRHLNEPTAGNCARIRCPAAHARS